MLTLEEVKSTGVKFDGQQIASGPQFENPANVRFVLIGVCE
jgi:hypothetical protein